MKSRPSTDDIDFDIDSNTNPNGTEFQRYIECYTSAKTESPSQCTAKVDDYFECLHHRKEKLRIQTIKRELLNQKNNSKNEDGVKTVINVKSSLPDTLGFVSEK